MSFNDLKMGSKLPPPPPGTKLTLILVDGDQERGVTQKTKDGAGIYSTCNAHDEVGSVSVIPMQYNRLMGAVSPTRLYSELTTDLNWTRGNIDPDIRAIYDQVCYGSVLLISRFLQPFRDASQKGEAGTVPIGDLNGEEQSNAIKLVQEYGFHTSQPSLEAKLHGKKMEEVRAVIYQHGSWIFRGVDLDLNQQLDVLVAQNITSGTSLFLYDLEKSPPQIQQSVPAVAPAKKEVKAEVVAKTDRPKVKQPKQERTIAAIPEDGDYRWHSISTLNVGTSCSKGITYPPYPTPRDLPLHGYIHGYMGGLSLSSGFMSETSSLLQLRYRPSVHHIDIPFEDMDISLTALPKGRKWELGSLSMKEPMWHNLERGNVSFSMNSVSETGKRYRHIFDISFSSTEKWHDGTLYLLWDREATLVSAKAIAK